jgi:hypothetical protein
MGELPFQIIAASPNPFQFNLQPPTAIIRMFHVTSQIITLPREVKNKYGNMIFFLHLKNVVKVSTYLPL